jgi:hypothetical protein
MNLCCILLSSREGTLFYEATCVRILNLSADKKRDSQPVEQHYGTDTGLIQTVVIVM